MCGIAGFLYRDGGRPASPDLITAMCDVIAHRGPDDSGVFVDGPLGIGMRRLSIIDLAGGHQPMRTTDDRFTIVFNGEIYNHREVRARLEVEGYRFRTTSDTEVILNAYAAWGPASLEFLNGMFAIALWDSRERTLFLARDRAGIKPLYLYESLDGLWFGSEIKSLLATGEVPGELNGEALHYFLRYGYVPSSSSLLAGVRQLPPAHYMLVKDGQSTERAYWDVNYQVRDDLPEHEWPERVYSAFHAAVKRQLISDVPLGAFLSGGLDSSSIVSVMSDLASGPVSTYSIGFKGKDAFHSELDDARVVAQRFGTRHHEIVVEPDASTLVPRLVHHLDQPLADSSFLVTYMVSTLARQTATVIISGVGGDEVFGGYRRYLGPRLSRSYQRIPAVARRLLANAATRVPVDRGSRVGNLARLGRGFLTGAELAPYEQYDDAVSMLPGDEVYRLAPGLVPSGELAAERRGYYDAPNTDTTTRLMHLDLKTSLVDSLLLLTDKMTMATSLEARVPFLDHELIELVAQVPARLKIRGTQLRDLQRRAMRPHLPAEVFGRRKRGFGCPVGRWFREDLRDLVRDLLAPPSIRRDGLFDSAAVQQIVEAHEQRRADRTETLLALVTFQIWREQLRDATAAAPIGMRNRAV